MNARPRPLRFDSVRNFGRILADTRNFVRENFVVFFKTILFLAGPFILLTCALEVYYQVNLVKDRDLPFNRLGTYIAFSQILRELRWALNGFVVAIVVSHFIKVYREKGPGKFEVGDVTASLFKDFFGNAFTFLILFGVVAVVTIIPGYLVMRMASVNISSVIPVIFAGFIAYFLLRFPFWYFIFSVFFARTSNGKNANVFQGLGLAGKVFSGNWWQTWAVFFVIWLILFLLGRVISLPAEIAQEIMKLYSAGFMSEDSELWRLTLTILGTFAEFAKTAINSVACITIALHFHSMKEKLDGEGTKKLIDSIGTKDEDEGIEYTW
ncbi:MAG TPA: hypothetical protein VI731_02085 [Bacteroidia bacterium]|nr:hypothetical protein [Bacteroidia bacterium]